MRPEALAEVVGIRSIESSQQAAEFEAIIGSKLYLIEFADGEAVEVPERWIEAVPESDGGS